MRKRWRLVAVAHEKAEQNSVSYLLAKAWGDHQRTFWFRWNAQRTAHFYERVLGMPVNFYVVPNSQVLERSDSQVADGGEA